jgi:hypothetical protein
LKANRRFSVQGSKALGSGFSPAAGQKSGLFDRKRKLFLEPDNRLRSLWERFLTAINSVGSTAVIVVKNHSHQASPQPEKNIEFNEVS